VIDTTVISGVPGVGASEVCRRARQHLGDSYKLLNFGDVMLEKAIAQGIVSERADLGTLSRQETRRLQRRAGEFVSSTARTNAVLVNTHFAVATAHGFLPGLHAEVLADIDPTRLVLIEADAETIADRRQAVDYREYREQGVRAIDLHQDLNRAAAMHHALEAGCPVRLVGNETAPDDSAETLTRIVTEGDPK
jgi:Archaeal adenylate kinase